MANTLTISVSLIGSIASVSLATLARSDTNLTPDGAVLPLAFVNAGGGVWIATFTDDGNPLASWYFFGYTATRTDTTTFNGSGSIQGVGAPAVGIYTSQAAMEQLAGAQNIAEWSNVNASDTGINIANIQVALNRVDDQITYIATYYKYTTPITAASCINLLQDAACDMAICELYLKRGIRDTSTDVYAQFQNRRREAIGQLKRIFKNRIDDQPRTVPIRVAPFVELDPSVWPYAIQPIFLPSSPAVVP